MAKEIALECGLICYTVVSCGVRSEWVASGVLCVVCGVLCVACCVWCVVCGLEVRFGVRCILYGVECGCGVWCDVLAAWRVEELCVLRCVFVVCGEWYCRVECFVRCMLSGVLECCVWYGMFVVCGVWFAVCGV